ncbi:hypothetical protein [Leptospira licerasiae]|uniref:hypothetical protein n=1 Tax=Leptospira licerasiae TaxID=447106 RepID=UPI001082F615|nr:hypothetical protein [Leptospira licerasiae]TGM85565.1 hypothetical protein EHR05_19435 [Leptospira licerasiae]
MMNIRYIALGLGLIFGISCTANQIKEQKAAFEDKVVQIKIVEITRKDKHVFGRNISRPKDSTKDFFVVSVMISNVSSEKFIFAPAATMGIGEGENKQRRLPDFVDYCCNLFEEFGGNFKTSILQRYPFDDVTIEAGESILREFYYIYPRGVSPKYIMFFENGDEKVKVKDLGLIEIVQPN